jgi:hypothetical protein
MPLHDWTRVSAGTYHAFHDAWITFLQEALNKGILPEPYYALGEQRAGETGPDLLALHEQNGGGLIAAANDVPGMLAVADAPPRVHLAQEASLDSAFYLRKRRTLVIRHASGDRIVALLEIVSPANKHNKSAITDFVNKVHSALRNGIHVLVIDPFPPGKYDPQGIHNVLWEELGEPPHDLPADRPLTLISYCAKSPPTACVEPTKVGLPLIEMPLFLTDAHYIRTPLEATYMQAWEGVPGVGGKSWKHHDSVRNSWSCAVFHWLGFQHPLLPKGHHSCENDISRSLSGRLVSSH